MQGRAISHRRTRRSTRTICRLAGHGAKVRALIVLELADLQTGSHNLGGLGRSALERVKW